jgi:hypothetical protein
MIFGQVMAKIRHGGGRHGSVSDIFGGPPVFFFQDSLLGLCKKIVGSFNFAFFFML